GDCREQSDAARDRDRPPLAGQHASLAAALRGDRRYPWPWTAAGRRAGARPPEQRAGGGAGSRCLPLRAGQRPDVLGARAAQERAALRAAVHHHRRPARPRDRDPRGRHPQRTGLISVLTWPARPRPGAPARVANRPDAGSRAGPRISGENQGSSTHADRICTPRGRRGYSNGRDGTGAGAQAGLKRILDRGKLIVGTRSTTIGFGFKDAQGELVGFDIDLAKAIAKGLLGDEKKIEFEIFPGGAERVPALTSGRVDIVISQFSVFESRAQVIDFSLPYCNSDFSAIVKASSPYLKHKDLNGKVVTTRQGDELKALILGAIPEAKVEMYPNFSDSFTAFRQGRAEAFFNDSAPAR